MKKDMRILIVMVTIILLISGCGSSIKENGLSYGNAKIVSSKMSIKSEMAIKEEKVVEEKQNLAIQTDEKKEKLTPKEQTPTYTIEEISGDFMSTISLNMRKGPSADSQIVGTLQPYAKAMASEKATLNGATWYKITSNDMTGWSAANYLVAYEKIEPPTKETEVVTAKKQTTTPAKQENESKPKETPKETPKEEPKETPKEVPKETPSTGVSPSAVEQAVIDLTNAERKKAGLTPYKVDAKLVASARAKSKDMATNNYFNHHSPTYGSIDKQLGQFGVSFRGWGENIAKGQQNAEQVVTAWMNSPGHKENILNPKMTHIGVGFDANGNHWTQQFIYK